MPSPDTASLEALSLAELGDLVGVLVSEVARLRALAEGQRATIAELTAETSRYAARSRP
jgi:uncharacterized small protein (DUF1192 family)